MLSPEVQAQADEIRRNKSLVKSLQGERDLWKSKAGEAQAKLDELAGKSQMSDEDREEIKRQAAELDALNDELEGAAQANTAGGSGPGDRGADKPADKGPTPDEIAEQRGKDKADGPTPEPMAVRPDDAPPVPLMPTSAFDPAGGVKPSGGDAGQPQQPAAIETAGGFVLAGGGSTQRAPGSRPESPSSSVVVPEDPTAKGPASTADEVKSGLGDSRGNERLGNDGQPVEKGPGIVQEPTDADRQREQERLDKLRAEQAAREANPLNLSDEDLAKRRQADAGKGTQDDAAKERQDSDVKPPASPVS